MTDLPKNETSKRILDAAEELFMTRGYKAVRLRDIAEAIGMRHASLYYYVPKGKEQLFIAVVRRSMERHQKEMARVIRAAGDDIGQQAYAISDWLVSQPPVDLARMTVSDLREIDPTAAHELGDLMLTKLTQPLVDALERAQAKGQVNFDDSGMAAMSLITLVQSVHQIPLHALPQGRQAFGRKLVDMLLFGWLTR